ncbi:MAG: short-chain dehydrogenase [Candidatus Eremiobacter antarcticus]|nr:SDR family oxidoreductase [Candidatus Eremiobacteraeota bacterium]MBC5807825.1 SDR family oxidoreductase [Candidatus Eremiobacteraeota bacterium]PZR60796.1 MAG: short-chain dehydrogenase [Candidatus Eremiobacter sp. RRmetagenome_bin22]
MDLQGKVALITGASRGLGLEIAKAYAKRGARLMITARTSADLERAAAEIRTSSRGDGAAREPLIEALAGDVADSSHARRLIDTTVRAFGRLDILINNASELGPSPMPSLEQLPIDDYHRILDVNAVAPLQLTQFALPHLKAAGEAFVINVSSDAGVQAYPGWGGYGSSKAALEHWSRILAAELDGSGVRILVVDPGDMNTEMHRQAEPGVDLAHLPGPERVARAFVRFVEDVREPFARLEAQKPLFAAVGAS